MHTVLWHQDTSAGQERAAAFERWHRYDRRVDTSPSAVFLKHYIAMLREITWSKDGGCVKMGFQPINQYQDLSHVSPAVGCLNSFIHVLVTLQAPQVNT